MVSFASLCSALAIATAVSSTTAQDVSSLAIGAYFRPTGSIVSGRPGATTPYRRSPCPGVNTLANHGYLPRDGRNVSKLVLRNAVMTHYNLDEALANFSVSLAPDTFDLDLLGTHGIFDHDASLVHPDAYFGRDPAFQDPRLLADFLSRASETQPYTTQIMGEIRRDRLAECMKLNPNCTFSGQAPLLAFGEATFVIKVFGDGVTDTAPYASVKSFVADERFPADYKKPALLTIPAQLATFGKIQAAANSTA